MELRFKDSLFSALKSSLEDFDKIVTRAEQKVNKEGGREEFEKKHWGAMFEFGDYEALLKVETEIIEKLIEDVMDGCACGMSDNARDSLRAKWLGKDGHAN